MTRRAVISYALTATRAEKIQALTVGIIDAAGELAEMDVPLSTVERYLDDAYSMAEQVEQERHGNH